MKSLIGTQVGDLTVVDKTPERKCGYTVWRCRCTCGNEILLDTRYIQRGTIKDCGCKNRLKPGMRDITGQRFGHLIALKPLETKKGETYWRCSCDCGNVKDVVLTSLLSGNTTSCGCQMNKNKDITNQRFGHLIALYPLEEKHQGRTVWHCCCDCGNEKDVVVTNLTTGITTSCGCKHTPKPGTRTGNLTVIRSQPHPFKFGCKLIISKCDCGNRIALTEEEYNTVTDCGAGSLEKPSFWKCNLVGEQYGQLYVRRYAGITKKPGVLWECVCSCGNTRIVSTDDLHRGRVTTCEKCFTRKPRNDWTGVRRGNFTGIRSVGKGPRGMIWEWRCDCGNVECRASADVYPLNGPRFCEKCIAKDRSERAKARIKRVETLDTGLSMGRLINIVSGKLSRANTSGIRGVSEQKKGWVAYGSKRGQRVFLGLYPTLEEAAMARAAFVAKQYPDMESLNAVQRKRMEQGDNRQK